MSVFRKSCCVRAKLYVIGQKMVEFEKTGKYLGEEWLYSGKVGCTLGKSGCIQAKWL